MRRVEGASHLYNSHNFRHHLLTSSSLTARLAIPHPSTIRRNINGRIWLTCRQMPVPLLELFLDFFLPLPVSNPADQAIAVNL